MNTTGTCTTGKEVVRVLTKEGDGLDGTVLPRQGTIVLQHHDTLGSTLTGDGSMCLEIRSIRCRILVETRGLHDIFEHTTHITIHIGDVETTILNTIDDLLYLSGLTWFHQIVTCMDFTGGGQSFTNSDPVGHDDTLESPVLTENLGKQVVVAHRELTIHLIIRSHDCPWVTLSDSNLEASEIEFAGCALRHTLIDRSTIGLLGIDGEMLG